MMRRCAIARWHPTRQARAALTLTVIALSWNAVSEASAATYVVVDVAPAAAVETTTTYPNWLTAINASGWVVGTSIAQGVGAFIYNNTSIVTIPAFSGGSVSRADGINAAGTTVGFADTRQNSRAFRRTVTGAMTNLGTMNTKGFSVAHDVNNSGLIVGGGTSALASLAEHAFKYDTQLRDIGVLPGTTLSQARAVNTTGVIVGRSWGSTLSKAFRYQGTTMTDIGGLGGNDTQANDINDAGVIVGSSRTPSGQMHAFSYDGAVHDLTPLATFATALGINNRDEVVGSIGGQAFLISDGRFTYLNSLIDPAQGWHLASAHDINDQGQIVGVGTHNGQNRTFRLDLTLLGRYAPELRYDLLDTFRADSAATLTDNTVSDYSSRLLDATDTAFADANWGEPIDDLSLGYLRPFYPAGGIANGRAALPTDNIDAHNDTYEADALRMHALPQYAHRVYGRTITEADGRITLQYWLFYYFNWHPLPTGIGDHEGDWEMIQIELDPSGNPTGATYAQHNGGERCAWPQVRRTPAGHPVVFVARGSHASYFSEGSHVIDGGAFADQANGDAEWVTPTVIETNPPGPSWLDWPGRWGGTGVAGAGSPDGPAFKGQQWLEPRDWSAGVTGCSEGQPRRVGRQFALRVDAIRAPGTARLRYQAETGSREGRATLVVTSLVDASGNQPPLTTRHLARGDSGILELPTEGRRWTHVAYAAYNNAGHSSRTRVVPIR